MCAALNANASSADKNFEEIVLGGGCFWCLDAAYRQMDGVADVISGYAGGHVDNPSYREVCAETTGHAEVVKVVFDPSKTKLEDVLDLFWKMHDSTQVGGQGHDMGTQYRSIILYASPAQKAAAEASKATEQASQSAPVTTEIVPLTRFWPAEDYHQNYFAKNPTQGYCSAVVRPKVAKVRKYLDAKAAGAR